VLERTLDGRDALTICKKLTREKDCNRKLDKYEEKSKAYLCIDILEQELKRRKYTFVLDPISIEESIATPLLVDNFHMRLINLENRGFLIIPLVLSALVCYIHCFFCLQLRLRGYSSLLKPSLSCASHKPIQPKSLPASPISADSRKLI
jgi:hypothetical protein